MWAYIYAHGSKRVKLVTSLKHRLHFKNCLIANSLYKMCNILCDSWILILTNLILTGGQNIIILLVTTEELRQNTRRMITTSWSFMREPWRTISTSKNLSIVDVIKVNFSLWSLG